MRTSRPVQEDEGAYSHDNFKLTYKENLVVKQIVMRLLSHCGSSLVTILV